MKKREFIRNVSLLSVSAAVVPSLGLKSLLEVTKTDQPNSFTGHSLNMIPGEVQNAEIVSLRQQ